ncbi:MAG TPA: TIGR04282 family arsenosugar biosynthesis glycosyltransferase [Candidatus Dormibacteraeota bacterium]
MSDSPFRSWSSDEWLILLARWPQPGVGKSRLAAGIGDEQAYRLEQAFLMDTIGWASLAPAHLITFTPAGAAAQFRRCAPRAHLRRQAEGDLGVRIHQAFVDAFSLGARRAVIVGSDSPNLPYAIVDSCRSGLPTADAMIAPTSDGGFCALGLTRPAPELFVGVAWSTPDVCAQVMANARAAGLEIRSTEPWYDVDDVLGLNRLRFDLSLDGEFAPNTSATLARINRK